MGRLAIIEEDGGGGGNKPPAAQESPPRSTSENKKIMSSSDDTTSVTSAVVASMSSSSPPPAATASSTNTKSAGVEVSSTSRMKQGGVSDESGYYEGDEYRDDSIEIVYDRQQNQATRSLVVSGAITNNTTMNNIVVASSSSSSSAVSITPLAKNAPTESNGKSCCCSFNYLISSRTIGSNLLHTTITILSHDVV